MKKILAVLMAVSVLVGCKSLNSIRSKQPVDSGVSTKSVNEFASCVSAKWDSGWNSVTSLPLENGISILIPQGMGGYDVVLDVTSENSGSAYVLYERVPSLTPASYENNVKACK